MILRRQKPNPRPCNFVTVGVVIYNNPSAILQRCEMCGKRRVMWRGAGKDDLKIKRELTLACPDRYLIIQAWKDFGELPQPGSDPLLNLRFKPQPKGLKYE